jgi:hypothetical protein
LPKLTWGDGFYVNYDRDLTELVTAIRENGATSGVGVLAQYTYDVLGNRTAITRGNGVVTNANYDGASRLRGLAHTLVDSTFNQAYGFGYNAASQINSQSSSNSLYNWTGSYAVTRGYTSNGLNQLKTSGALNLTYDAWGNLTSDGVNSYGYDAVNQLTSGPNSATLVYDPLGRLVQTSATGIATTELGYAGDQLVVELDTSGNVLRRYVPGPEGGDDPVVWYEGSGTASRRWLLADQRGTVVAVSDATGTVVNGAPNTYDEYGVPASANQGRFQYTGQQWVREVGLYHYKARAYSPTLGRFMQELTS